MNIWASKLLIAFMTFIVFNCSDDSTKVTGGGSETEAGIQVSVLNSLEQPVPRAVVHVYERNNIAAAIDSFQCDLQGICNLKGLKPKSYLLRSDLEDLMSMSPLNLEDSYDSNTVISLYLAPPSSIQITSFKLDSSVSLARIGIAGFDKWDTLATDSSWKSSNIPLGEHILIVEGIHDDFQYKFDLGTETLVLPSSQVFNSQEPHSQVAHIIIDDFTDRGKMSDWSQKEGLLGNLWQYQGEVEHNGKSDSYAKDQNNLITSFINLADEGINWSKVKTYFNDIDTSEVGGLIIPAELDSSLLPYQEPYLDLVMDFYSTDLQPFQKVDSISLVLMSIGSNDFQIVALDAEQQSIDHTERIGTQGYHSFVTLTFKGNHENIHRLAFRSYGNNIIYGYIVAHVH